MRTVDSRMLALSGSNVPRLAVADLIWPGSNAIQLSSFRSCVFL